MDLQSIVQFINSVGFPIVCCTALFCQNNKQDEQHEKEMSELKNVIENNTLMLHELATKIDNIKEN